MSSTQTEVDMDTEQDLRDVFKLMYDDEDDWEVEEDDHPPLDSLVPDIQVELQEDVQDDYLSRTYSRKRFRTQLDALIPNTTKKRRIFPSPLTLQHYHPSTLPLPPLPSYTIYEPYNPLSYLARLRTFHPSLYSPFLPQSISPIRLAGNGWFCSSRDGVECRCGAKWGVGGLIDIKDPRVREEIGRRLGEGMVDRHMAGCGWRILSCPDDIMTKLRHTLHTPIASNIASLSSTLPPLDSLSLNTRLSEKQISNLTFALSRHSTPNAKQAELAFFGWSPHALSEEIVQCRICQRRVGLWAFSSPAVGRGDIQGVDLEGRGGNGLDPVAEHLNWCPLGIDGWWDNCALLKGGRGNIGDLTISKAVKRRKWIKA